jgi:hypothetical protein
MATVGFLSAVAGTAVGVHQLWPRGPALPSFVGDLHPNVALRGNEDFVAGNARFARFLEEQSGAVIYLDLLVVHEFVYPEHFFIDAVCNRHLPRIPDEIDAEAFGYAVASFASLLDRPDGAWSWHRTAGPGDAEPRSVSDEMHAAWNERCATPVAIERGRQHEPGSGGTSTTFDRYVGGHLVGEAIDYNWGYPLLTPYPLEAGLRAEMAARARKERAALRRD